MSVTPADAVDAANALFGRHPGYRALHAKGTLLRGTFTATPEAARLTRAPHMQGDPIPVTVRVSNGAGDPDAPDYKADVRGFAMKLYLPDGSRADIVAQTVPRFPVSTPDAFVRLMHAQQPGPSMAWKLPAFFARHPKALTTLPGSVRALRPLESYATTTYYALHAFGPVRFTLRLQVAAPEDPVNDPSAAWPGERAQVNAGTIELTGLDTEREQGNDVLVFDPTRVTDGIELSDDPVLRFRPHAYAESITRRTA